VNGYSDGFQLPLERDNVFREFFNQTPAEQSKEQARQP
jgi:hypothetical protein